MKQDTANFLVVNTAAIVTTLSLNMIVPSITLIGENLGIAYSNAQLIIGVFLFVYAFSLLVVTQVTARFGERHALILALSIFTCGSLICTFSPSLPALLFGERCKRLAQLSVQFWREQSFVPSMTVIHYEYG